MSLNKQSGNMYGFITHTWNAIKGKCSHDCIYCYMKVFPQKPIHFDIKELNVDLGKGNTIFVGSSTDMFANDVPKEWIKATLLHCSKFPENTYLFQSKNPSRMKEFQADFPKNSILGTTIETDATTSLSKAPQTNIRLAEMIILKKHFLFKTYITIEPITSFNLNEMVAWIDLARPDFVNIGADSKHHNLPEPSKEKIMALIKSISHITKVNEKDNLKRLLK